MMIALPGLDGVLHPYQLGPPPAWQPAQAPPQSRIAYAAAHVVADPLTDPAAPAAALDWDATLRLRRHLWAHGLRVGEMLDPQLAGYWGSRDIWRAAETLLQLTRENITKIDGVKVSLLDASHEVALRAALPTGVRLYTGDDVNYPSLIASGSDAMLGIFDAIAPAAAAALHALDEGDKLRYEEVLSPTMPLARKIFEEPTYNYKTGLAFVAWLAGHQDAFVMLRGAQSARSLPHLAEVFRLADYAGLLPDPDLAVRRMSILLAHSGTGQ